LVVKNELMISRGQNGWCFLPKYCIIETCLIYLFCQIKRKRALLESNLPGIHLTGDEKMSII